MDDLKTIFIEISQDAIDEMARKCEANDGREKSIRRIDDNSSLNRTLSWFETLDCAAITAWRKDFVKDVNKANNKELKAKLRGLGYGVIHVLGFYPEGGNEITKEESFIVVNIGRDETFKNQMKILSEYYDQDSFLFKRAGAENNAILVYTKDLENIEKGTEKIVGKPHIHPVLHGPSSVIRGKFIQFR